MAQETRYFLETINILDKVSNFCWEVKLISSEPKYGINYNPLKLRMDIKSKVNVFKRIVLVEKYNQKKLFFNDEMNFFEKWYLISLSKDNNDVILSGLKHKLDFKLTKVRNSDDITINTWFLQGCRIEDESSFYIGTYREREFEGTVVLSAESFTTQLL